MEISKPIIKLMQKSKRSRMAKILLKNKVQKLGRWEETCLIRLKAYYKVIKANDIMVLTHRDTDNGIQQPSNESTHIWKLGR